METIALQVANLRLEIAATIWQLTIGIWLITGLAAAAYMLASGFGGEKHYRLSMILVISGLFFTAREDYLMHRAAGYITMVESKMSSLPVPQSWESYKGALLSTKAFLPLIDVLAGFIWIYIFCDSVTALKQLARAEDKDPPRRFLFWAKFGFVVGWASPFVATYLAGR